MKKFISVMFSVLLLFLITGCNSNDTTDEVIEETEEIVEVVMPEKGQNISVENNEFKVIKIEDGLALLLLNKAYGADCEFGVNIDYEGSNVDQTCQEFYESLSDDVKNAVIEQEIDINEYQLDFDEETDSHPADLRYSSLNTITTLKRNAFVLDVKDIEEYFNGSFSHNDILTLFNNRQNDFPWLRSGCINNDECVYGINSQSGTILAYAIMNTSAVRPALVIDLNKVMFESID